MGLSQALAFGHQHAHQLATTHDHGGEFATLLVGPLARLMPLGVEHGGKAAQGLRVDAVDLGQSTGAAREVTRLAWVDDRDPKARGGQSQGQSLLIAPVPCSPWAPPKKKPTR